MGIKSQHLKKCVVGEKKCVLGEKKCVLEAKKCVLGEFYYVLGEYIPYMVCDYMVLLIIMLYKTFFVCFFDYWSIYRFIIQYSVIIICVMSIWFNMGYRPYGL